MGIGGAAAHGTGEGVREQRAGGRRRKKREGKRERRKEKKKREKREGKEKEKEKKEKEMPAGFAAMVASRAWRRREATRTRNEETCKVINDD